MDRIVRINVSGNYISKDSKTAGVRGEGNSTSLVITFDEGWDDYAKTVTFWDARGENPVERTLTTDLLENINDSTRIYKLPIPYEAMAEVGYMTFIIDGYVDGKRKRSASDTLEVKYSPDSRVTADATPTEVERMQASLEKIIQDIQSASIASTSARASAESAKEDAEKAEIAVGKTSYIGDNGNWYAWDGDKGEWYDTGVKAQAGSTVYVGDNPPDNASVWIDPNGIAAEDEVLLKDQETNQIFKLYVINGELRIKEVEV